MTITASFNDLESFTNVSTSYLPSLNISSDNPLILSTLELSVNNMITSNYQIEKVSDNEVNILFTDYLFPSNSNSTSRYKFKVTIKDEADNELKYLQTLLMTEGIKIRDSYLHDKTFTYKSQLMANDYPVSSDINQKSYSVGQQILSTFSIPFHRVDAALREFEKNRFFQTANIDFPSLMYAANFEDSVFKKYYVQNGEANWVLPELLAIDGITKVSPLLAADNHIYSLFYLEVPDRIYATEVANNFSPFSLLNNVEADNQIVNIDFECPVPLPLYISISNETQNQFSFIANGTGKVFTAKVKGKTPAGIDTVEGLIFASNKTLKTSTEWSYIESITITNSIESTASISAFIFKPLNCGLPDYEYGVSTPELTSPAIWSIEYDEDNERTFLIESAFETFDLFTELSSGNVTKKINSILLQDVDGNDLHLIDIDSFTFKDWLIAVDYDNLYLFTKFQEYPQQTKSIPSQSPYPTHKINPLIYRDDSRIPFNATVSFEQIRFDLPIQKSRLNVIKPDGSTVYLNVYGQETTADLAWLLNADIESSSFPIPQFTFTFEDFGSYIFNLEVQTPDNILISSALVFHEKRKAMAQYKLSEIPGLWLDSLLSRNIYIAPGGEIYLYTDNKLYKLSFIYDKVIIDFDAGLVLCKENYDLVEIVA